MNNDAAENTPLHSEKLDEGEYIDTSDVKITDEDITIGAFTIKDYHDQDCCEDVSAEFDEAKQYENDIKNLEIVTDFEISAVKDTGFLLTLTNRNIPNKFTEFLKVKILVPCHNNQNGYYSDRLDIIVTGKGKKIVINLNEHNAINNNEDC